MRFFHIDDGPEHQQSLAFTEAVPMTKDTVVFRRCRRTAECTFTKKFSVVRNGDKIQRPVESDRTDRVACVIQREEGDRVALRESMRMIGIGLEAVCDCIEGISRMHMQVAKQRLSRIAVIAAGLAIFGIGD